MNRNINPPYYAVIFTSNLQDMSPAEAAKYERTDAALVKLAEEMPEYLGVEYARRDDKFGITISYWKTKAAIIEWKNKAEHLAAQNKGAKDWYTDYRVRVSKVERDYTS